MVLKVPKNVTSRSNSAGSGGSAGSKRRRAGTVEHCDYLSNKVPQGHYCQVSTSTSYSYNEKIFHLLNSFMERPLLNLLCPPTELPTGQEAPRGPADLAGVVPGDGAQRLAGQGRSAPVPTARQLQEGPGLPRQGEEGLQSFDDGTYCSFDSVPTYNYLGESVVCHFHFTT